MGTNANAPAAETSLGGDRVVRLVPNGSWTASYGLDNDAAGFRLAGSYGQDNWQIAYNYRAYDHAIARLRSIECNCARRGVTLNYLRFIEGEKDTKYTAHSFGGTVDVDKLTFGFGYQLENLKNRAVAVDLDRNTFSFDVGYSFTSKARIILAFSKTDTDEYKIDPTGGILYTDVTPDGQGGDGVGPSSSKVEPDKSKTYLLYRIDF